MKQRKRISLILALALTISTLLSGCGQKRTTKEIEEVNFGIDVAKYQEIIDWKQVASSPVDFVMIRLGYRANDAGEIVEDVTARYNLQEAAKAGIPMGVYFFSTAISEEEAVEEAQWVADFIAKYPITYPVVYDCEGFREPSSRMYGLSKRERTDNALAFLKTIEKLGYEGMFYASKNEMQEDTLWEVSRIEKKHKIWVAQYPEAPYPETTKSSYPGEHSMWQFSTKGDIPGVPQNVDLNIAYFGYDGIEPPKDSTPPEEVEPNVEALMYFEPVNDQVTAKVETNLRSIPSQGEDVQILHALPNGEFVERIGISPTGWSKLIYNGTVCYAVTSYLSDGTAEPEADGDADGIQTVFKDVNYQVTAKDVVNLRSIPSVTSEDAQVISQLKKGEFVTCIGVSDNGWSKLMVDGKVCYAVSSYLETTEEEEPKPQTNDIDTKFEDVNEQVTAKDEVNLRNIPSTTRSDAKVVVKLKHGDVITRTGINRDLGWSRVEYRGQVLYCVSRLLEEVK